ncbi:MAG: hypothetical protein JWO65_927 [Sphingomonas bacterium]|jgi:hypothetical protein|nr:hypothetical protein [Sphingomonas bacterium]
MHMKKTIALPLIIAVAMGAAACKKSEDTTVNNETTADLNAAANDAMADVNAATDNATDASANAVDNASTMEANSTNAM